LPSFSWALPWWAPSPRPRAAPLRTSISRRC